MLKEEKYIPGERYTIRKDFDGEVNHPHEEIYAQMKQNIRRQYPQMTTWPENDYKAMVICGGPSATDFIPAIKRKRKRGWKLITVNNTHEWVQDHGMEPSMHVMLDARQHNVRFIKRPVKKCRYLLCSQVHGDVFDALEGHDIHIWHPGVASKVEKRILDSYYRKRWLPSLGGTSVGPRGITLAVQAGIRHIEVYGLDCCLLKGKHHAYAQPENDFNQVTRVRVGRRVFRAHAWMIKQADEFLQMAKYLPDGLKLALKGDGMMAYIIERIAATNRVPALEVLDTKRI